MAKIYISSTYIDLKKERQEADRAIRRLGHMTIAMEDYVASDVQPVDKCLCDVKRCDAYVGIFAWKYGSIPTGYDKSITHLEYEAAREVGIPCLIFLLDEKTKWPTNHVAIGEERDKIDEFRRKLKDKHIVSFFTNADKLGGLVSTAVTNTLKLDRKKFIFTSSGKTNRGQLVSKKIDRSEQLREFWDFFLMQSKKCLWHPQFYFLHGGASEGHDSFIELLQYTYLKKYAEETWGKEYASIRKIGVPLPDKGNCLERQSTLRFKLRDSFEVLCESDAFDVNKMVRLSSLNGYKLVIIKHKINDTSWNVQTEQLITWYIKNYWNVLEIEDFEEIPLFLIFFIVKNKESKKIGLKQKIYKWRYNTIEHIKKYFEYIHKSSNEKCPCQVIKELTSVGIEDVENWFVENDIYYSDEMERYEKIESIFIENNQPVQLLPMAKVVRKLQRVLTDLQREETII